MQKCCPEGTMLTEACRGQHCSQGATFWRVAQQHRATFIISHDGREYSNLIGQLPVNILIYCPLPWSTFSSRCPTYEIRVVSVSATYLSI